MPDLQEKSSSPQVTIGLPVFNGEKHLDSALATICCQNCSNLEILISDNASTDRTPEILQIWASQDARIRIFRQSENIGAHANYDWVLKNASGEWFVFAAYDDRRSPDYVEKLLETALANPGIDLVVPKIYVVQEDDQVIGREHCFDNNRRSTVALLRQIDSAWYYGLFRRQELLRVWNYMGKPRYLWGADMTLLLHFILCGKIMGNNEAIFYQYKTGLSYLRYAPKSFSAKLKFYVLTWLGIYGAIKYSGISTLQALQLLPTLYRFSVRGGVGPRVLFWTAVQEIKSRLLPHKKNINGA